MDPTKNNRPASAERRAAVPMSAGESGHRGGNSGLATGTAGSASVAFNKRLTDSEASGENPHALPRRVDPLPWELVRTTQATASQPARPGVEPHLPASKGWGRKELGTAPARNSASPS